MFLKKMRIGRIKQGFLIKGRNWKHAASKGMKAGLGRVYAYGSGIYKKLKWQWGISAIGKQHLSGKNTQWVSSRVYASSTPPKGASVIGNRNVKTRSRSTSILKALDRLTYGRVIKTMARADQAESVQERGGYESFDLADAKNKIGDYELEKKRPDLSPDAEGKLHKGCRISEEKRKKFLERLEASLTHLPPEEGIEGEDKPKIQLLDLFGGDKELLDLYKEAVKEEKNSKEFRDAVFAAAAEEHEINPCPRQKMVMYIGGPSAAGKSFTRTHFVEQVREIRNSGLAKETSYVVSVDGGIDREFSQMRQMVLQAALAKGYAGIEDLHEKTDTSVKEHVRKAAMVEGNHMHLVIPATFISGFASFLKMFRKYAANSEVFQVFAEVRADKTSEASLKGRKADEAFQNTIVYNGNSRAYYLKEDPDFNTEIRMNNRKLPCESKAYNPEYFSLGVEFSKKAKKAFKLVCSPKRSLLLSNESDNMHVVKNQEGRYAQAVSNPEIKHVSRRLVDFWNEVIFNFSEDVLEGPLKDEDLGQGQIDAYKGEIFEALGQEGKWTSTPLSVLGLNADQINDVEGKIFEAILEKSLAIERHLQKLGLDEDKRKEVNKKIFEALCQGRINDLKDFKELLNKNDVRAELKITNKRILPKYKLT